MAFDLILMSLSGLIRAALLMRRDNGSVAIVAGTSPSPMEQIDNGSLSIALRVSVASLAKQLSRELAPTGVRITDFVASYIDSDRVQKLGFSKVECGGLPV